MAERLLTLVRHGQTVANAQNLLQGHVNHPLDDVGLAQVSLLGAALQKIAPVDRVISSPLLRAQQTAQAITRALAQSVAVETDPRWIELNYGDFDGQPVSSVSAQQWTTWRADEHFRPPHGETLAELAVRVHEAIDDLLNDTMHSHIVVVSHVSPIKAAVAWALGVGVGVSWRTALDRASMTTVRLDAKHPALKTFNVTV
ncbi:MAG: histidine phosphatase family protein [Actinomycetes bacterium]